MASITIEALSNRLRDLAEELPQGSGDRTILYECAATLIEQNEEINTLETAARLSQHLERIRHADDL